MPAASDFMDFIDFVNLDENGSRNTTHRYGSVIYKWPSHAVPPTMMARPGKLPPQLPVGKVGEPSDGSFEA